MDKTQVGRYAHQIQAVEDLKEKAFIGITYGKRDSDKYVGMFKQYLPEWERRTLIGVELWDYVSGNEAFHIKLMDVIKSTASAFLNEQSIIRKIDDKVLAIVAEFKDRYGTVESYLNTLW